MPLQNRETALQNEVVRLYCQFMNNGVLTNPAAQPLVEIISADGATVIDSISAQMEYDGVWYVDWYVPQNQPLGIYYDKWTFQWFPTSSVQEITMPINVRSFDNYINFISRGISHSISNRTLQLLKDLENDFIYEATHIPIYWEQGMRVQQEDQQKRVKDYYYFELGNGQHIANEGDVYFNNGQKFTVFSSVNKIISVSSSSSSDNTISSSSSYSLSSEEIEAQNDETIKTVLTCVGTGQPTQSGILVKVTGDGSENITFKSFANKKSRFSTVYNFAFRNWVRDFKPILRINQRIVDDGWYADYDGNIYVDRLMSPNDSVECCYKFSCFSTEHLLSFLRFGLMMMNSLPPASETYNRLDIMPVSWNAPVLLYAAIQSLRRTLYGMNFQEKRAIYGGAGVDDGWAQQASSIFQNLYQDYNTQWTEVSKDAKTKKLPGVAMYVTPEYTLPGGRSRWFRYLYKTGSGG